jgi:hypothetical protein
MEPKIRDLIKEVAGGWLTPLMILKARAILAGDLDSPLFTAKEDAEDMEKRAAERAQKKT